MTSAQIKRTLRLYEEKLDELLAKEYWKTRTTAYKQLQYLKNMIPRFPGVLEEREKAMRWLCFMQGVLWSLDIYTVEDLKKHNAEPVQSKKVVAQTYHNHSLGQHTPCGACGDLDGCHKWREYEAATDQ